MQSEGTHGHPSMLWPGHHDAALKSPEQQLLDAVASGALDAHLVAIADAIHVRQALLDTARAADAIAELAPGDTVMFNRSIRPRYLAHEIGTVLDLEDGWVTVELWRPVGRFGEQPLRCPPLALKRVGTAPNRSGV